ncbi:MAG: hypothetical protein EOP46_08955 [Sphingobacteriaceae bacterium]|nr:MAG: hypothetical protein EOP46_08955 [Sphingobacteriaceae bacterium]
MKTAVLVLSIFTAILFPAQTGTLKQLNFLSGVWKVENRDNYEVWQATSDKLTGSAYKIRSGNKQVTEYFTIMQSDQKIVYTAIVPTQNNGQPVNFVLNATQKDKFSFENPEHDFPTKVQYTKLNDTTLFVNISGGDGRGFSYKMFRQKREMSN